MEIECLPLDELCRKATAELAYLLEKLRPYPTLWTREKEWNGERFAEAFLSLNSLPKNPISIEDPLILDGAVFTWTGRQTSLGAIRMGEIEIRAFGPQTTELGFGIEGVGMKGWTRMAYLPEVWLEMRPEWEKKTIHFRFVGLTSPIHLAFYVKSPSCQIGDKVFRPKSLTRFAGEAKGAQFGEVTLESPTVHKVELIPLAGEGCFWNTDFLFSYEIHPFSPQVSINFSLLPK